MELWEKRLLHARCYRDALVKCGNHPPDREDPPGRVVLVEARRFVGVVVFKHMRDCGHTTIRFEDCDCALPATLHAKRLT